MSGQRLLIASDVLNWTRRRRKYSRMVPLWDALVDAFPSISMDSSAGTNVRRLPFFRSRAAMYRMIVEIHDGLRRLRAYPLAAAIEAEETNRIAVAEQDAMRVAIYVTEGLRAHRAGNTPGGIAPTPAPQPLILHSGGDLDGEATWLAQVADAFGALDQRRVEAMMRRRRRDEIVAMNRNSSHFPTVFPDHHSSSLNSSADWR